MNDSEKAFLHRVFKECLRALASAVLAALGLSAAGCSLIPIFNF